MSIDRDRITQVLLNIIYFVFLLIEEDKRVRQYTYMFHNIFDITKTRRPSNG